MSRVLSSCAFLLLALVPQCALAQFKLRYPCEASWKLPPGKVVGEFTATFNIPDAPTGDTNMQAYWNGIRGPLLQSCLVWGGRHYVMDNQLWGCQAGWKCEGSTNQCGEGQPMCNQQSGVTPGGSVDVFYRLKSGSALNATYVSKDLQGPSGPTASYEFGFSVHGGATTPQMSFSGTGPTNPMDEVYGAYCETHNTVDSYPTVPFKVTNIVIKDQQMQPLTADWHCGTPAKVAGLDIHCEATEITVTFPPREVATNNVTGVLKV